MNKSESRKKLKEERFSKGLCVYCGKTPHVLGKKGCLECLSLKYKNQIKSLKKDNYIKVKLYRLKKRQEVIIKYGGKCKCCGESSLHFLIIDHINEDGGEERKKFYGSQNGCSFKWFLKLLREPLRDDLQVLCWNCNMAKHHFGTCPHQNGVFEIDFSLLKKDKRRNKDLNIGNKINWPSNEKLIEMINQSNCMQVANKLGVSHTAIRNRLKRRNLYNKVKK